MFGLKPPNKIRFCSITTSIRPRTVFRYKSEVFSKTIMKFFASFPLLISDDIKVKYRQIGVKIIIYCILGTCSHSIEFMTWIYKKKRSFSFFGFLFIKKSNAFLWKVSIFTQFDSLKINYLHARSGVLQIFTQFLDNKTVVFFVLFVQSNKEWIWCRYFIWILGENVFLMNFFWKFLVQVGYFGRQYGDGVSWECTWVLNRK